MEEYWTNQQLIGGGEEEHVLGTKDALKRLRCDKALLKVFIALLIQQFPHALGTSGEKMLLLLAALAGGEEGIAGSTQMPL